MLDAVVITGGEPTLQTGLVDFIKQIKNLGYLVKLDTNGLRPTALTDLFKQKLIDYAAMDIKTALKKYAELIPQLKMSNVKCQMSRPQIKSQNFQDYKKYLKTSIKIIINNAPDYEFRSTLIKGWHTENDFQQMTQAINGAKKYFLQKFVPQPNLLNPDFKKYQPFSLLEMQKLAKQALKYVKKCEIRY